MTSPLSTFMVASMLMTSSLLATPPAEAPLPKYHLTARPWSPLEIPRDQYLDRVDGVVRFSVQHQDKHGAIIDPFFRKEHQYATPYYAHALGVLLKEKRAIDLKDSGIRALDWATKCFETNNASGHRVFYLHALLESIELYKPFVPAQAYETWRKRTQAVIDVARESKTYNWGTYLMLGDWLRYKAGLMEKKAAVDFIEEKWKTDQRPRIADTPLHLYHDTTSDPDTLAVEAVGRVNLLALVHHGYDGPSADEMKKLLESGTRSTLLLQDPSGQMPCNGRTDDHVWADIGYMVGFEIMANRAWERGEKELAGQYRYASMLTFQNIDRWRRTDGEWAGSYFVTKNHFDPPLRVGYQRASQYSNYNGSLMHHLAEAYELRATEIPQHPPPNLVGGYAFALDDKFASAFANAGGMQLQFDLRGDTKPSHENPNCWCALGLVRIGRPNWDTRLGPADGTRVGENGPGVSFAPTFEENGKWLRLASLPERYEGKFSVQFVHPVLVRCAVDYVPRERKSGPSFRQEFTVTPDGVLVETKRTAGTENFGVTLPLLANDGRPLQTSVKDRIASCRYADKGDEQNFIVLDKDATLTAEGPVRSTFGDLMPVRATGSSDNLEVFIYPRRPSDPPADQVRDAFHRQPDGFASPIGSLLKDVYQGTYAAGGVGDRFRSLRSTGLSAQDDASFSAPCGFVLQYNAKGKITAFEADRDVTATIDGKTFPLTPFTPVHRNPAAP
jgi:hypothetical protein